MRTVRGYVVAAAALGIGLAGPAAASTYLFTITPLSGLGDFSGAAFTLPQSPTPTASFPNRFEISGIDATFNGAPLVTDVSFFVEASLGGLNFGPLDDPFLLLGGEQLFTGTTAAPTFRLGTFTMTAVYTVPDEILGSAQLVIQDLSAGGVIPEPATWATLIAGFGIVGAGLRRRRARVLA